MHIRKITNQGSTASVAIPPCILKHLGVRKGDFIAIQVVNDKCFLCSTVALEYQALLPEDPHYNLPVIDIDKK